MAKRPKIKPSDIEGALLLLPEPLFRPRDVYPVAKELGFKSTDGQSLWTALQKQGRIVRTGTRIGKGFRRFYWERT